MTSKVAIIVGAGPAGLTTALELLRTTDVKPLIYEASDQVGGISKTINYNGNRMDIGGHRFFSKSDWVMDWWQDILPIETADHSLRGSLDISYQNKKKVVQLSRDHNHTDPDKTMLVRKRLSRIYYLGKFFDYPISLNIQTIRNLGIVRLVRITASYLYIRLFPITREESLEDFLINRFGHELYSTFFKDYTEKVWGVPCREISPEWGAQRIKGLSITKALIHALKKLFKNIQPSISQKNTQTSLIERFLYPKYGPGQMWQEVASRVSDLGGTVVMGQRVVGCKHDGNKILSVTIKDIATNSETSMSCDYLISSMPVRDLTLCMDPPLPPDVMRVSTGLQYRDFITVGLLVKKMAQGSISEDSPQTILVPDNWIYIQEQHVKVGRLQVFNNWSPHLVSTPDTVWLGLEYFCNENDELWNLSDDDFKSFAIKELSSINLINSDDVLDGVVVRVPKAYPAYFGTYDQFDVVRQYLDGIDNLFLVGRNGMHRYNNQDHSMITAKIAAENIKNGITSKDNIWSVNVDDEYHEEKTS